MQVRLHVGTTLSLVYLVFVQASRTGCMSLLNACCVRWCSGWSVSCASTQDRCVLLMICPQDYGTRCCPQLHALAFQTSSVDLQDCMLWLSGLHAVTHWIALALRIACGSPQDCLQWPFGMPAAVVRVSCSRPNIPCTARTVARSVPQDYNNYKQFFQDWFCFSLQGASCMGASLLSHGQADASP